MGLFGRNTASTQGMRAATELLARPVSRTLAVSSPWSPTDGMTQWAVNDALSGVLGKSNNALTRDVALRIPAVKRAHGIICTAFAAIPFYEMAVEVRTPEQPSWLTSSGSGVSPYHRMFGAASDWFFHGWALFGFTWDKVDCLHIPFEWWSMDDYGVITLTNDAIPAAYTAYLVPVPLGYGENGLLVDGADTIAQARNIEAAYQLRLDNPIPLTILEVEGNRYDGMTPDERASMRDEWNEGRRKNSTGLIPSYVKVNLPGATVGTDLYETGRNAARLDVANHVALPASIIEGVRQGGSGGGTEIRYSGIEGGATRSEMWDHGLARRMVLAFEARMSLDDVCPSGLSIRGDLTSELAAPTPNMNPTSED